jgi:phage-related protein
MKFTAPLLALPLLLLPVACSGEDVSNAASKAMDAAKDAGGSIGEVAGNLSESLGDIGSWSKDQFVEKLGAVQPAIESAIAKIKDSAPDMESMSAAMKDKLGKLSEYKDEIPGLLTKLKDSGMDGAGDLISRATEILKNLPGLLKGLGDK